ncbi:hypothetical protein FISHEDRAFT_36980 [Fistulina hepatica ATCC 64428]|uniref:ATP phosphoribosyltransferase n=1 Tax=Fistulina hepatica ATCC 64428 TaxID=1128425 RepID=A0A0D7AIP6_9AGAR|nr:hypothetical protein FISHEDRAFT_36980 [Fistulina hepatica ATCC 64428]
MASTASGSLSRCYKLVFFSPSSATAGVLQHLFSKFPNNVGKIGNYEGCAFVSPGTGQFRPVAGANPTIGIVGKIAHVQEDRVEVRISGNSSDVLEAIIRELKTAHPYEEVAYDVYKLEKV